MLRPKDEFNVSTQSVVHHRTSWVSAPSHWANPSTHDECTMHQLSPYIGKLKSGIAKDLIAKYTEPGDLIADPFCGSGTVPLEATNLGRRAFASDASLYATVLTKGKLHAPQSLEAAEAKLERALRHADALPVPDCSEVPPWVRQFFHPATLSETIRLARHLRSTQCYFLLACLLGILHHQRPGFLSYPASNLVPYLRTRKFPREKHPDLYEYRPVAPRLRAKLKRAFARPPNARYASIEKCVRKSTVEHLTLPSLVDCIITSPPYMNALDYARDNRLRLWFLNEEDPGYQFDQSVNSPSAFQHLARSLGKKAEQRVHAGGHCIVVVGEKVTRDASAHPSSLLREQFSAHAPSFRLIEVMEDCIPDIRRSRRNLTGVKREHILVFYKVTK